jgi:hypothetical protein
MSLTADTCFLIVMFIINLSIWTTSGYVLSECVFLVESFEKDIFEYTSATKLDITPKSSYTHDIMCHVYCKLDERRKKVMVRS